ncbi:MAG: hypothetical protein CVU11_07095 [Bacteroidetes bacterium HGW-Bacteroidetes-6]|jgi:hypothetical protein|nr:MAG: hypothetical protein CVU11_07095 [Bacteroidetes bacterium HGW-Bacteroidetes-6]
MKKLYVIVAASLMLAFANQSMAQSNAVKLNIFSLIFNCYNVSYERAIDDMHTVQLGFYYWGNDLSDGDLKSNLTGIGVTPEFRIYFDEALSGFYVAPFLRYQNYSISEEYNWDENNDGVYTVEEYKAAYTSIGGGVLAGHQWLLGEHFTIDSFIGPAYYARSFKVKDTGADEDFDYSGSLYDGFTIRFGVTFGFAF